MLAGGAMETLMDLFFLFLLLAVPLVPIVVGILIVGDTPGQ